MDYGNTQTGLSVPLSSIVGVVHLKLVANHLSYLNVISLPNNYITMMYEILNILIIGNDYDIGHVDEGYIILYNKDRKYDTWEIEMDRIIIHNNSNTSTIAYPHGAGNLQREWFYAFIEEFVFEGDTVSFILE